MNYVAIPGIKSAYRHQAMPEMNAETVIKTVCEYFEVSRAQVESKRRDRLFVWPRQVMMYFLFFHCDLTKVKIGKLFRRDHTTVIHSLRTIKDLMKTDSTVMDEVHEVRRKILENHQ